MLLPVDATSSTLNLLFLFAMPQTLDPDLRRALADRVRYYNELGIYDFYRRDVSIESAFDGRRYFRFTHFRIQGRHDATPVPPHRCD